MNNNVFVSCAVTGSGDTAGKHPDLPKTPEEIALSILSEMVMIENGASGKQMKI